MDGYSHPATGDFLEASSSSYKTLTASENVLMYEKLNHDGLETGPQDENEQPQDNYSQTSTPSCISKLDYTLPKYRNNVSPAIDKLMQMMNMPSLITSQDSSNDLPPPTNRISSPGFCRSEEENKENKENFAVPIVARKYLDICFSSPKPFVSTYKRDDSAKDHAQSSRMRGIDRSLSQTEQEPVSGWQEIVELPDDELIADSSRYEVKEVPP